MRIHEVSAHRASVAMARVAMKEHTFSNGVTIPAGITVEVATGIHHDEDSYQCAEEFLPFRFVVEDEKEGEGTQRHFTSISSDYRTYRWRRVQCMSLTDLFSAFWIWKAR